MGRPPKSAIDPDLSRLLQTIGGNITDLRKAHGITLAELSARSKVSISTLNEIEKRRFRDIRLSTIAAIAKVFAVPVIQLLLGSDIKLKSSDRTRLLRASEDILRISRKLNDGDKS